ncbi:hypothetical protein LJC59_06750 [Desulfovibrio sp. OttesenSCG-928-A18]|nr:hypothetical protein [Desulfovibrio sp. OttesenSCG-928-A18]
MNSDFTAAVSRITEVVMFENWLRFYFIDEQDDKLYIRLPEKAMQQLRSRYANLYGLAEYLNEMEIEHKTSLEAVCLFVSQQMDGGANSEGLIARVFDSLQFQVKLQLFGSWVQSHEEQLDSAFMEFSEWQRLFAQWLERDEVREYARQLMDHTPLPATNSTDTTQ